MKYRKKPVVVDAVQWTGVNGEFYPCKAEIFEKTYEKVDEE